MDLLPLSEACLSEILARVTYRVIRRDYFLNREMYINSHQGLIGLSRYLANEGFAVLSTWVAAYAREISPMTPAIFVRDAFIFRARQGYTWRHVVFPQYKRNRSDPRVTNRGVARETLWEEKAQ